MIDAAEGEEANGTKWSRRDSPPPHPHHHRARTSLLVGNTVFIVATMSTSPGIKIQVWTDYTNLVCKPRLPRLSLHLKELIASCEMLM